MLCRYYLLEFMILEDFSNAFHPVTLYPLALSFVPYSKASSRDCHACSPIWQIFCFSLYVTMVTAAIFLRMRGYLMSLQDYISRKFLCLARQTSQWQRSACTSWSITPTILRFTLFVFNTSFTANEVLNVRSNNHRVLFISMLTNTCIVDNFVSKHISNDLCLIFLYKALLLRMR